MLRKAFVLLSICCICITCFGALPISAEEQPYTIDPVIPSNQDKGITNYISISSDKSELSQTIEFLITNNTNEPLEILVKPLNALTSPNGVIQYKPGISEENSKLIDQKYSMTDYVEVIDKVVIPGGSSKVIEANIKMSDIEGTILGAIGFQAVTEQTVKETDAAQFKINNETNNIIGLQVNFGTDSTDKFIIDDPYVDPMPSFYAIRLPISLHSPLLMNDVALDYVVSHEEKKLFESKGMYSFNFAPESKANFALPWDNEEIEEGETYTIKGTLTYQSNGEKSLDFEKEFTFTTGANQMELGKDLSPPNVKGINIWLLLAALLVLFLILFMLVRNRYKYILFSNQEEGIELIDNEHELFPKIVLYKDAKNEEKHPYMLIYKPIKKNKKIIAYQYKKTKNTRK